MKINIAVTKIYEIAVNDYYCGSHEPGMCQYLRLKNLDGDMFGKCDLFVDETGTPTELEFEITGDFVRCRDCLGAKRKGD